MIRAQKPQMFRSALSSSLIWAFNPKFPSKFNHLFFADNYSDQAPRYIKVDVAVDVDVDEVMKLMLQITSKVAAFSLVSYTPSLQDLGSAIIYNIGRNQSALSSTYIFGLFGEHEM